MTSERHMMMKKSIHLKAKYEEAPSLMSCSPRNCNPAHSIELGNMSWERLVKSFDFLQTVPSALNEPGLANAKFDLVMRFKFPPVKNYSTVRKRQMQGPLELISCLHSRITALNVQLPNILITLTTKSSFKLDIIWVWPYICSTFKLSLIYLTSMYLGVG